MRHLHWFQNDLRLSDHPLFSHLAGVNALLCVYLLPKPRPWCQLSGLGPQRDRVLRETLSELQSDLQRLGQNLLVLEGSPELVLPDLIARFDIDRLSCSETPGYYEAQSLAFLRNKLPIPVVTLRGNCLFDREQLPFTVESMPDTFTPFRKRVEELALADPDTEVQDLPATLAIDFPDVVPATVQASVALPLPGGRAAGLRRLRQFIDETQHIRHYKETRNDLDPLSGSTTLSPWLANGSLSVREVARHLFDFESRCGRTDSSYWLYFELLWREFFYWRALRDGKRLFARAPAGTQPSLRTFEPRNFARWCSGDTAYPLVNALMHQLVETGWMSNRGRQLAASCLINELNHDWRYGAAFFEQHLIDFDVASNYGNWQYIAGCGADPQGGRHFDLDWQTARYDPDGRFVAKWRGVRPSQPEFVTDAADWPLP